MAERSKRVAAVLVAAGAWLLGGCEAYPSFSTWVAGEMVSVTEHTPPVKDPDVFDTEAGLIKLFAAANETIGLQIVIDAGPRGAAGVRIKFADLVSYSDKKIAAKNLRAFRMWPVKIETYPPWYLRLVDHAPERTSFYDPLTGVDSPQGGQPYNVDPNSRLAFWLDVHVPRGTPAGNYAGAVKVASLDGWHWQAKIDLRVYDFVLPEARPIAAVGSFDHRMIFRTFILHNGEPYVPVHLDRSHPPVKRGLEIVHQLMRLARQHRLDLFDRHIHPELKRTAGGKVRLDWENYDAIVMPYLTGSAFEDRMGCVAWPVPFHAGYPDGKNYGGIHSEAYAATAAEIVTASRRHFSETPELAERIFCWPYRGEVDSAAYERHVRLAGIVRAADRQMPILSQLPPAMPNPAGWSVPKEFSRLADIFAPRGEWFNPADAARLARPEHPLAGLWLAPGTPPYVPSLGVIATPADVRALAWFAMKYKCTGLFLPEVLNWSGEMTSADAGSAARLFYPGTIVGSDKVLPSVRLKRLRRGLQDAAYLSLLKQRQRMGVALAVTNAMVRYAGLDAVGDHYLDPRLDGWVKEAATWRMARRMLAEEVQSAVHPGVISSHQLLSERLAWQKFDEKVQALHVEQIRARVQPAPATTATTEAQQDRLRATVSLDLYNEYSRSVDARVEIDNLPDGWQAVKATHDIAPMLPAARETVTLTAEGTRIAISADGKMPIRLTITNALAKKRKVVANVAFLRAGRAGQPPRIDGRLDDWPMLLGNTAGSFKLVGRRGQRGKGLAQRQTVTFVLTDDRNLYIAFRCQQPDTSALFARRDNIIRYQQLMAHGEDLVEVILDPGAAAQSVEDLYHIVVKANGVMVTERGVRCDPPLGKVEPWAAEARVAVGRQEKLWIVELAIPLASFGRAGKEPFWGVNFTRFATQGGEASSWSGASRYFYDPRSLGGMYIAQEEK